MRRKKCGKRLTMLLCAAILASVLSLDRSVWAVESDLPSLIHNEEAWYKDAVAPLVFRDGKSFIPAELLSMFDGITVTVPREDNLLIQNTATGWYLSVLFREQSAAENGRIVENVGVFRASGMYYVEAELACAAVGLTMETYTGENGRVTLRVSDANRLMTLEQLLKTYMPEETPMETDAPELPEEGVSVKQIYVLCATPESAGENGAQELMDRAGLDHTRFLGEDASLESILRAAASGSIGLLPSLKENGEPDLEALRRMNDRLAGLVRLRTHLVLSTGSEEADGLLRKAGYRVQKPDFILDGSVESEELFSRIREYLDVADSCTVLMGDVWNCGEMTELLTNLNPDWYTASGLARQKTR